MGAGSIAPGWSNGKACAVAYARAGGSVACVDRRRESAEETAELIRAFGGDSVAIEADATIEADAHRAVATAVDALGGLDVMHNNVGVGGTSGAPDDIPPDAWDREIAQNLTSAYLGIRAAVPALRACGGGAIINTSSLLAVRFLRRPTVAYSAAKAGVEALTRSSAVAYGPQNIRVNCIRIGFSETPLVEAGIRHLDAERQKREMAKSRGKVPLRGEHTSPFDVAATAVFLASDDAQGITGAIFNVDGGLDCAPI